MHISEGVLSPVVLVGGYALTAVATYIGLRQANYEKLTTTAVLASVFFVASLIHVPIGPSSVHLLLNGLFGVFLGWAIFPALLIALLLQAILFQFGGIAVLGVNTFSLAFPALVCHYIFRSWIGQKNWKGMMGAFSIGALSIVGTALCVALALALSNESFLASAKIILLAHIPLMLLEGFITSAIVAFVIKVRPELLQFTNQNRFSL